MKVVTREQVNEIAHFLCDFKSGKEAYNNLVITCCYGSHHDLKEFRFDLSNEALDEVLAFIQSKLSDPAKQYYTYYGL